LEERKHAHKYHGDKQKRDNGNNFGANGKFRKHHLRPSVILKHRSAGGTDFVVERLRSLNCLENKFAAVSGARHGAKWCGPTELLNNLSEFFVNLLTIEVKKRRLAKIAALLPLLFYR
jgi:hypothetical protein